MSLKGQFLLAPPMLPDVNFYRSIVLMMQHDHEGAIGLILNRPTDARLNDTLDFCEGNESTEDQVIHVGGPVDGPLMTLHTIMEYAEQEAMPGVYVSSQKHNIQNILTSGSVPYRVFSGYSGWTAGQLEEELERGGWITCDATSAEVFSDDIDIWKSITQRVGHQVIQDSVKPDWLGIDPITN